MLYIKELENNIINLEKSEYLSYEFTVVSKNPNGLVIPFFVEYLSNENINIDIKGRNILSIDVNPSLILKEEIIVLANKNNDVMKITIVPNEYYTMEKKYSFRITSKKLLNDGSLKLKIYSKVNDMDIGWKNTYDGKPMEYSISSCESDKGEHVIIMPLAEILSEFESYIEFTQDESNNKIRLVLTNTPEMGITQIKKVD